MKNILVPVDFSNSSKWAADFAYNMASNWDYKLHFVHVVEFQMAPVDLFEGGAGASHYIALQKDLVKIGSDQMEALVSSFPDVPIESEVVVGKPYVSISEQLINKDIDLVVMGTNGASGLSEFFLGSNAARMVRKSKCPVITLSQPSNPFDINKIVFAFDLQQKDDQLIQNVKELQETFKAKLEVVRVNTPNNFIRDHEAMRILEQLVSDNELKDVNLNIYNDVDETSGIISFAEDVKAGIIALGTHGRQGLGHIAAGSIAEEVVNHSKIPVWTNHIGI